MGTAKVIDCHSTQAFITALREVPADANVGIIQSITSFLAAAVDTGSIYGTIDPVLAEFASKVGEFCLAKPDLQVMLAPPMFRTVPVWYRKHLAMIAQQFSNVIATKSQRNLHLLPSCVNQDLVDDGVHLTPVAGLHYVLHLFDEAERVVKALGSKGLLSKIFCLGS